MKPNPYALTVILTPVLLYFAFAFVQWDLNPKEWGQDARALLCVFSLICSWVSLFVVRVLRDE